MDESDRSYTDQVQIFRRLREGICANGCGPLVRVSGDTARCPMCEFRYRQSGESAISLLEPDLDPI